MEIQTAFAMIAGVLMVAVIVIAGVSIMGGLTTMYVQECENAEYDASTSLSGLPCGYDESGTQMKCDRGYAGQYVVYDQCVDTSKGYCCPTASDQRQYKATVSNDGSPCGKNDSGSTVFCEKDEDKSAIQDECIDAKNNICSEQNIRIVDGKCCHIRTVE